MVFLKTTNHYFVLLLFLCSSRKFFMKENNKIGRSDLNYLKKIEKINVNLIFFKFSIVDKRVSYEI